MIVLSVVVPSQPEISKQHNFIRTNILVLKGPMLLIYPIVGSVVRSRVVFVLWVVISSCHITDKLISPFDIKHRLCLPPYMLDQTCKYTYLSNIWRQTKRALFMRLPFYSWQLQPYHPPKMEIKILTFLESESHSIVSNFSWPHGLYSPWNSPGQNTGVGSISFPGDLPNPGIKPRSPALQADSLGEFIFEKLNAPQSFE